ncbi:hypothetical protein THIOM_000748 [Candidatus Thiomargarita nelsonii]|uniref:Uncharacterized protein n=1 Tax=Candidatus Thiomargarita nelsonii TaxID=1003181 RepID=A0A176S5Y0_9GAMM|nr:hypothetical protein THIOM_000748 [Candidatus Thiomargarita nelsonii]
MRMPITKPAPTKANKKRINAICSKVFVIANKIHKTPEIASNSEYMMRGPNLSTSIPIAIRDGMVSETLRIINTFTCWLVKSSASLI